MTSVSVRLLLVWLLGVITGTLAPFGVTPQETHVPRVFGYGSPQQDPTDFVRNLLLFMPMGALLHHEGRHRSLRLRSIVILAGTAGVLISVPLEYLQAFRLRNSSLIDVMANTGGALMGVAADRAWGARGGGTCQSVACPYVIGNARWPHSGFPGCGTARLGSVTGSNTAE